MKIRYIITILLVLQPGIRSAAQVYGCTDRLAANYVPAATINNGSCIYSAAGIAPVASLPLAETLSETSGLISWNNFIWTHNDNLDTKIYCLDTLTGNIVQSFPLTGVKNTDWEEISQDEGYIYIGDFGNNYGNRRDLKILKISKNSLTSGSPVIDSISYVYSDQADFTEAANDNDYDCEAFIVSADSIYLFTKQWASERTSVYSLSKNPGDHVAKLRSTFNVNGLITGAVYLEQEGILVLTGYSGRLEPFLFLLYDFSSPDFFGGNKRKIDILLPYYQVEGIATSGNTKFYITNEHFSFKPLINIVQQIHVLDLTPFLGHFIDISIPLPDDRNNYIISPVPVIDYLTVKSLHDLLPEDYALIDLSGQIVLTGRLTGDTEVINVSNLASGMYILRIGNQKPRSFKVIRQ
jgi:hypothetical protein